MQILGSPEQAFNTDLLDLGKGKKYLACLWGGKVDYMISGIPFRRMQGKGKKDCILEHVPVQKLGMVVVKVWYCKGL